MAAVRVVRSLALVLVGGVALTACAMPQPKLAYRLPQPVLTGKQPTGEGGRYKVGDPYQVAGIWYVPKDEPGYDQQGVASWYGAEFNMKPTANGEVFDMTAVSAAHPTLPLPSLVEVTNLDNGRKIQVRVNDRGPFVGGRLIDLSHEAARQLGYDRAGVAHVRVKYVGPAPLAGPGAGVRYAAAPAAPVTQPTYTPPLAQPVSSQPLAALPYQTAAVRPAPAPVPAAPQAPVYRIQAGAFGDQANAQRVASQLSATGAATIEPVERDGVTLYRVILQSTADEGDAWAMRDRVAASGYGDARVLRPF